MSIDPNDKTTGDLFGTTIEVPSESDPGVTYTIDTVEKTCTCPAFEKSRRRPRSCKHLIKWGVMADPTPTYPSISQAMSAFIKSYRLRWEDEACYWAAYIWLDPKSRFRLVRRLIIASGEDNLSIPVVASALKLRGRWKYLKFSHVLAEVMRACRTDNWWAQEDGREYIHTFAVASKHPQLKQMKQEPFEAQFDKLVAHVDSGNPYPAVLQLEAIWPYMNRQKELVSRLFELARQQENDEAAKTFAKVLSAVSTVGVEGNLVTQGVYRLARGHLGQQVYPLVRSDEVEAMLAWCKHDLRENPHKLASYFQDGVHTTGGDRRFAGLPVAMNGLGKAYLHYGRADPKDKWPPEFWKP